MSLFDGVDVVFYQVCSMDKAVEFYNGILGLEVLRREGNDWTELRAGETVLALSGELATRPHQGGATVILKTSDIGAVERTLGESGVQRGRGPAGLGRRRQAVGRASLLADRRLRGGGQLEQPLRVREP